MIVSENLNLSTIQRETEKALVKLNHNPTEKNLDNFLNKLKQYSDEFKTVSGYRPKIIIDSLFLSNLSCEVIKLYGDKLPLGNNKIPFDD